MKSPKAIDSEKAETQETASQRNGNEQSQGAKAKVASALRDLISNWVPEWVKSGKKRSAEGGGDNESVADNEQIAVDHAKTEMANQGLNLNSENQHSDSAVEKEIPVLKVSPEELGVIASLHRSAGARTYEFKMDPDTGELDIWDSETKEPYVGKISWKKSDNDKKGNYAPKSRDFLAKFLHFHMHYNIIDHAPKVDVSSPFRLKKSIFIDIFQAFFRNDDMHFKAEY